MFAIICALSSGTCFTIMQMAMKRASITNSSPLTVPSFFTFLCPVWALALIICQYNNMLSFNFSPSALIYPFCWAVCTVTTTTLLIWLMSHFSLTEIAGYRKALIALGALAADLSVFHTDFPAPELLAITIIFLSSLLLSHTRSRLPGIREILALIGWCALLTIQITLYKYGQKFQPSVLSHTVIAQLFSTILYSLFWIHPSVANQHIPPRNTLLIITLCAFTGVILEGFAYAGLPMVVTVILTFIPAALFAAHDLYLGEIRTSPRTLLSLLGIVAGFLLLVISG